MHQTTKPFLSLTLLIILCNQVLSRPDHLIKHRSNDLGKIRSRLSPYLLQNSGNQMVSVLGAELDLNVLYLGTNGESREEISDVYRIREDDETAIRRHHESYSKLLERLEESTLINNTVATGIFVQKGVDLNSSYVSQVQSYYDAKIFTWDFSSKSSNVTEMINQFVYNQTEGKLQNIFSKPLKSNTRLIVVTAHYLNAPFAQPFPQSATKDASFDIGDGKMVDVEMMSNTNYVYYDIDKNFETILLPLADPDFYLMVLLPDKQCSLNNKSRLIRHHKLKNMLRGSKTLVHYEIPKMKLKWTTNIKSMLEASGILDIFTNTANFSNMVADTKLKVSDVIQAGELEFNENGIGAASGETSDMVLTSLKYSPKPTEFIADRLFTFVLLHGPTFYTLFEAKIVNPNEGILRIDE